MKTPSMALKLLLHALGRDLPEAKNRSFVDARLAKQDIVHLDPTPHATFAAGLEKGTDWSFGIWEILEYAFDGIWTVALVNLAADGVDTLALFGVTDQLDQ